MKISRSIVGIFSSTLTTNILFGKEYNVKLFQQVIHAAALEAVSYNVLYDKRIFKCCLLIEDLAQLPQGMNTLVGDRGVMLSGVR
jgi:ABC-type multidrug transport system fused ATPase/permease subunit